MTTIREIAKTAVLAKNLVPPENVLMDVIEPEWDGTPILVINCDPTRPEDEYQFGPITETTVLYINVLAETREEADRICNAAELSVYQHFRVCEMYSRTTGIYAVENLEHDTKQLPDRNAFRSYYAFNILHKPFL